MAVHRPPGGCHARVDSGRAGELPLGYVSMNAAQRLAAQPPTAQPRTCLVSMQAGVS